MRISDLLGKFNLFAVAPKQQDVYASIEWQEIT